MFYNASVRDSRSWLLVEIYRDVCDIERSIESLELETYFFDLLLEVVDTRGGEPFDDFSDFEPQFLPAVAKQLEDVVDEGEKAP